MYDISVQNYTFKQKLASLMKYSKRGFEAILPLKVSLPLYNQNKKSYLNGTIKACSLFISIPMITILIYYLS